MSATHRNLPGHERKPNDFYATPAWCTSLILPRLEVPGGWILDPCCGKGAILDVAGRDHGFSTYGIELNAARADEARKRHQVMTGDALDRAVWPQMAICTNPPYAMALRFVQAAVRQNPCDDAAFLLRLAFLEGQDRAAFHREHPSDVFVLPRRPSFVLSLSCKRSKTHAGCGWGDMIPLDPVTGEPETPAPATCPGCGNPKLRKSDSDSAAYAWFVFGPGRGGRWSILDLAGRDPA